MLQNIVTNKLFIPLFLLTIIFITYINILPNQLFFDDEELIYKNSYVQNISNLPKYFFTNMIAGAGKVSNMYRPFLTLSFAIDYSIWQANPFGFHLTSIILHAVNGILIFFLIYKLFKNRSIALLTALFFIVHPIQSEAIAYASGRTDPLYTFFLLTALNLFLSVITFEKVKTLTYLGTLFSFLLSILSKETAIILPFILILIFLTQKKQEKYNLRKIFFLTLPFFLVDAIYILLRLTFLNFTNTLNFYTNSDISNQISVYSQNILVRLYTFTKVFFDYIGIIIFPKDLIIARSPTIINTFLNPWVLSFIIIFSVAIGILIKTRNKFFLFAFFWFFITVLPVSGIIPINNIIAEHYLYLSSLAFFLVIAYFINWLFKKTYAFQEKSTLIVVLIILFSVLMTRTIIRTFDWRDPITFYTKSLQQSPDNIPMRNNLAMSFAEQGKLESAINQYKQLIAIADVYPNTHHNLANAYIKLGKYKEAEQEYLTAIKMDPNFYFSYYALVDLYKITGEREK